MLQVRRHWKSGSEFMRLTTLIALLLIAHHLGIHARLRDHADMRLQTIYVGIDFGDSWTVWVPVAAVKYWGRIVEEVFYVNKKDNR